MFRKEQLRFVFFLTQAGKALHHCKELRYTSVVVSMAPHLSGKEQDQVMEWRRKGCTPIDIHRKLVGARERKVVEASCLTAVRKFLKDKTHRRGSMETRGRKCTYSIVNVRRMNKVRKATWVSSGTDP